MQDCPATLWAAPSGAKPIHPGHWRSAVYGSTILDGIWPGLQEEEACPAHLAQHCLWHSWLAVALSEVLWDSTSPSIVQDA